MSLREGPNALISTNPPGLVKGAVLGNISRAVESWSSQLGQSLKGREGQKRRGRKKVSVDAAVCQEGYLRVSTRPFTPMTCFHEGVQPPS